MSRHTPGPWVDAGDGWIEAADGKVVCDYAGCGTHRAEWTNPADLRLTLAAPALLTALRSCAAVCAGEVMNKNALIFALEQAREAIAKATQP